MTRFEFADALAGLRNGDFSRLEPIFQAEDEQQAQIVGWHKQGLFAEHPKELAEAFTCACFLGYTAIAEYFLAHGMDPAGGDATGANALHWAADRGQLATVRLLLRHRAPLETRNMYGGTVLGFAVWSALHEPRPDHPQIVEELLRAGARPEEAQYPTGIEKIDCILRRYRERQGKTGSSDSG